MSEIRLVGIEFLESEKDFDSLIPFIKLFSEKASVPFSQQLNEVSGSFYNPNWWVIVAKREEKIVGYLCGHFLTQRDFVISQIFSPLKEATLEMFNFLEGELKKQGVVRLMGLSKHDPRVFEKYGYRVDRYLLVKNLKMEGN